eukprot:scaffold421220_cov42-Attheya_sp.AAC.5
MRISRSRQWIIRVQTSHSISTLASQSLLVLALDGCAALHGAMITTSTVVNDHKKYHALGSRSSYSRGSPI